MAPTYEEWLDCCFTRGTPEFRGGGRHFSGYALDETDPPTWTHYLTRLFEQPGGLATQFSRQQLADGIWSIFGVASGSFHAVLEGGVPHAEQIRCYRALTTLYRELFDPLCRPLSAKLSMEAINADALEGAIYMIWDMDYVERAAMWPQYGHLAATCFDVLAAALECRSAACKISALHGLGHLHNHRPTHVEALVGRFVRKRHIPDWIRQYAENARAGGVQ